MNIWTPKDAGDVQYPVMVYLHGGNFVHMSSSSLIFDGQYLAAIGEVIVITLDYRLGKYCRSRGYGGYFGYILRRYCDRWGL